MMVKEVIGDCTLYQGDCLELLQSLVGYDSVVMDPPYGIDYASGYATDTLWQAGRRIDGDRSTAVRDAALDYLGDLPALVFGSWKAPRPSATRQVLIWDKGGALGMGDLSIPWKPDHEEIYVLGSGFIGRRDCGSVRKFPPVQSMAKNGRLHPNQKPVALMTDLIRKVPGCILDPFMGSGSTGVAAAKARRHFIGIEKTTQFFDVACNRIASVYRQPDMFHKPEGAL